MRRKILIFILGTVYIILLTLLLLSMIRISVLGSADASARWSAALGALVIGIPWVIVLRLYIRVKEQISPAEKPQTRVESHEIFESMMQEHGLTNREAEVAWLLYRGFTNRQIGEELYIAETTVKKHVSHIYEKMQVPSRKEFRAKVNESPHLRTSHPL